MKKIGLLLITSLLLFGCSKKENNLLELNIEDQNIQERTKGHIIVDVRSKEEYETGHLEGAINIPYDEIDENIGLDRDKTIMVYCKSGVRSYEAYNRLINLGYDVIDLGAYDSIDMTLIGD